MCERGKSEKQTKECKREQQQHERDGKVENNKEEMKGERRTRSGKKKEEKQNFETEQGNKKVNVCQDKMDIPQHFNQKREKAVSRNEAHEEHISKDDTGK